MNEQIKELEKQAIEYSWNQRNTELDLDAIMREKFAELIVKECMNAVGDDPMAQPYLQRIKAKFGVEYYEPIEKAFGVEE